eukprot:365870-Rhodomonas_salina.1
MPSAVITISVCTNTVLYLTEEASCNVGGDGIASITKRMTFILPTTKLTGSGNGCKHQKYCMDSCQHYTGCKCKPSSRIRPSMKEFRLPASGIAV